MDENIDGIVITAMGVNEVAHAGQLGGQVVRHAVEARDEEVLALVHDLFVPGLAPVHPAPVGEGEHDRDGVAEEDGLPPGGDAVAEVEAGFDLGEGGG